MMYLILCFPNSHHDITYIYILTVLMILVVYYALLYNYILVQELDISMMMAIYW